MKTVKQMHEEAAAQATDQRRNYEALAGPLTRRAEGLRLIHEIVNITEDEEEYEILYAVAVLLYESALYPLQSHLTDNEFFTSHRRRTGREEK